SLDALRLSPRASQALVDISAHPLQNSAPPAALAGYYEPSAVFLLGTQTRLVDGESAADYLAATPGAPIIVADREHDAFLDRSAARDLSVVKRRAIEGYNYSKGDPVTLFVYTHSDSIPGADGGAP
ncbi:MAG: glycosyltransferase family 39 protein, partial [Pseudomonadota bacterium]